MADDNGMSKLERYLLDKKSATYSQYYNGKMSFKLHGDAWNKYVEEQFSALNESKTSENIFKTVIDLYAENLVPVIDELKGFSNSLMPLLSRGEAPVLVDPAGVAHFAEHYEMLSDGRFTKAAIFSRDLELMVDSITFADSNGLTRLYQKDVPADFSPADYETGFQFKEEISGNEFIRFALDDKGFGATLASLQDRLNHSIIDQTIVAEMYARPFWYLLNVEKAPENPFLPKNPDAPKVMEEEKGQATRGAAGRIFTTSSEGPFGQLEPPTIADMIGYHDSIIDKVPQSFGVPAHYLKPGTGTPPTGVALKVLSKRFNNKISRMREDIEPDLEKLAEVLGVEKNGTEKDGDKETPSYEFWATDDDLLQEALDAHGTALIGMGYPLSYVAEVVTPGVDLADYEDDTDGAPVDPSQLGQATDMTAMGQPGLPATPGQVQAYAQNPGQRAVKR